MSKLPRVDLYAIVWNEERILPYFFRHYDQFVSRYVIFDTGSTDGARSYLSSLANVDLRSVSLVGDSSCAAITQLKSTAWMEIRGSADWVIVCDVDEFLHGDIDSVLDLESTIVGTNGWQMVADHLPTTDKQIYDEVTNGNSSAYYSKTILFRPDAVSRICYGVGCHTCLPERRLVWSRGLKLLHFKLLGVEYVFERYHGLERLLRKEDRSRGWGRQYFSSREKN